jgi:hypothetical protein
MLPRQSSLQFKIPNILTKVFQVLVQRTVHSKARHVKVFSFRLDKYWKHIVPSKLQPGALSWYHQTRRQSILGWAGFVVEAEGAVNCMLNKKDQNETGYLAFIIGQGLGRTLFIFRFKPCLNLYQLI